MIYIVEDDAAIRELEQYALQSSGITAPIIPRIIPSITNGTLTKKSVAPISFIIPISSCRTEIPIVIVLLIRKNATASKIKIIANDTYPISLLNVDRVFAADCDWLT